LHPSSITKRFNVNVHGHTHANKVKEWIVDPSGNDLLDVYIEDPRYLCVCVEHTMYAPLSHEEVLNLIKYQKEDWLRSGGKDFWAEAKDGDQNPG
jgi:calcineurin-like phosphoesterase family protein